MSSNDNANPPQGDANVVTTVELKPMQPEDWKRMEREANERWENRPRPIQQEGDDPRMVPQELPMCRLPNGGVSDHVLEQWEQIRLRREAAEREKAAQPQEQQEELSKDPHDEL